MDVIERLRDVEIRIRVLWLQTLAELKLTGYLNEKPCDGWEIFRAPEMLPPIALAGTPGEGREKGNGKKQR